MIPAGVEIYLAVEPIDLRAGFNRLSGIALEELGYDPRGGALFVFIGKRRTALKVLYYDGTGVCLFYKRLDKGRFRQHEPQYPDDKHIELSEVELDALLDGIDLEKAKKQPVTVH
jgi:transposase